MTSFKSKITRRKRKLSTGGGIANVQFLATQLLESNAPLLENGVLVNASSNAMIARRKSDPAKFYIADDDRETVAPLAAHNGNVEVSKTVVNPVISLPPTGQCSGSFDGNSEIEYVNLRRDRNTSSHSYRNNSVDVTAPQRSDQMRSKPGDSYNGISSVRYSDSYVASKNTRDKNNEKTLNNNSVLKKSRSVLDSYSSDNSVDRSDSVKYKPAGSSLYRARQSHQKCATDTKMQYSSRQLTDADKQAKSNDGAENKRKNKKKSGKSKQLDADCNDSDSRKTAVKGEQLSVAEVTITDDKKNKKTTKDTPNNNSYLKRVKSKIYKHSRSDSSISQNSSEGVSDTDSKIKTSKKMKDKKAHAKNSKIPKITEDIPEESACDHKLKKSHSTNFLRQYSNLERVRPKSFGVKSGAFLGISDLVDSTTNILNVPVEQPKLTKSKSSSAINLNLLRSRRNKVIEQSKNCKNADTEFSFFTYHTGHKSDNANRKLVDSSVVDGAVQKERPSSWIFGGTKLNN